MYVYDKNFKANYKLGKIYPLNTIKGLIYIYTWKSEKYVIKEGIRKAEKYKEPLNIWKILQIHM